MTPSNKQTSPQSESVDRGLIAMFLKMTPEERIVANDNALRTILELRDAFTRQRKETSDFLTVEIAFRGRKVRMLTLQTLVELKRFSRDSKDRQRLVVLEETLRQLHEDKAEDD